MVSGISYWSRLSYWTRTSHDRAVFCLTRAPGHSCSSVLGGALSNINQHSESFVCPSHHTVPTILISNTEHRTQNTVQSRSWTPPKVSSANTWTFVTAGITPRIDRRIHDIWVYKMSNRNHSWNAAISFGRNQSLSSHSPSLRIKTFILVLVGRLSGRLTARKFWTFSIHVLQLTGCVHLPMGRSLCPERQK